MTNFHQLPYEVPTGLYEAWLQIKARHGLDNRQVCLSNAVGHAHDPYYGSGSLTLDWDNASRKLDGTVVVPRRADPINETDFTTISDIFRGTVFGTMLMELWAKHRIGRARFMTLKPHSCLTWHRDSEPRIHLPLKTQDGCRMVIGDESRHLPVDTWWWTNTREYHSVFNGSSEPRTHLVFCDLGGPDTA